MKTFKKILPFIFVLCIFPPASFSQESNPTANIEWTFDGSYGVADLTTTKTYKNSDGSRVFINNGIPRTPGIFGAFWSRTFYPNLEVPYKISAEFKLESSINLDSVETFLTLEDSLGNGHFLGENVEPLLNSEWQTLVWDVKRYENNPQYNLKSVKILRFSFQNRSRATYTGSTICVRNIKRVNVDNSFSFIDLITGVSEQEKIPSEFVLSQNYPNPFNPATTIHYSILTSGQVNLKVYDLLGREVAELVNEYKIVGSYEVQFNASNLSSGAYIYKLQTGSFIQTKKMLLMK